MTDARATSTRVLTLVVASALFMESLVSTVIATSLAAMAADLGVDAVTLKLAFTAYYLALAIFIPVSGWCADPLRRTHCVCRIDRGVHPPPRWPAHWPGTCPA